MQWRRIWKPQGHPQGPGGLPIHAWTVGSSAVIALAGRFRGPLKLMILVAVAGSLERGVEAAHLSLTTLRLCVLVVYRALLRSRQSNEDEML